MLAAFDLRADWPLLPSKFAVVERINPLSQVPICSKVGLVHTSSEGSFRPPASLLEPNIFHPLCTYIHTVHTQPLMSLH